MQSQSFFIPEVAPVDTEETYVRLAQLCNCAVPPHDRRIYSIDFHGNGEHWTATVGQTLSGVRIETKRKKGTTVERRHSLSDPALVLAIFPGVPYHVVTNHWRDHNVRSKFANPFLAGEPSSVTYFSATS